MRYLTCAKASMVMMAVGSAGFAVDPGYVVNGSEGPWKITTDKLATPVRITYVEGNTTKTHDFKGKVDLVIPAHTVFSIETIEAQTNFTASFQLFDKDGKCPTMAGINYHVSRQSPGVNIPLTDPGKVFMVGSNGHDRPMNGGPWTMATPNMVVMTRNLWE